MRIDTATHFPAESEQQTLRVHQGDAPGKLNEIRVIQIEPADELEQALAALRLQAQPVILLLPEQSQVLSDPSHFAQISQICSADRISFVIPHSRIEAIAPFVHRHGFFLASTLEQAIQRLSASQKTPSRSGQETEDASSDPSRNALSGTHEQSAGDEKSSLDSQASFEQQSLSSQGVSQPVLAFPAHSSPASTRKRPASGHPGLIAALVTLLVLAGAVLLPVLFSAQPGLTGIPAAPPIAEVGQITFKSSGQLDPSNSKGLNDIVTVSLHSLAPPAAQQSYYGWLMPDKTDDGTHPLLLGRLLIAHGKAQITYKHPDHTNLLASYSRFAVTEQPSDPLPATPFLDPKALRSEGSIPDLPTPGDEQHYSLLDHVRHLLAKDPTLQHIGLSGGLDTWLSRNAEKILEWSSAARDNWAGGQQTDLIHRHMIRVLDYLDGAAYVYTSGDVPPGSPLLVDPQMGRIGLLEMNQEQALPSYLTHVDIHLQGVITSPGHTEAQKQLAIKLDQALKKDTALFQKVRRDAIKLVRMDATQLQSAEALALLNEMVTNANEAYAGQLDPTTGGTINGIVWIHQQLQAIATMPVTKTSSKSE